MSLHIGGALYREIVEELMSIYFFTSGAAH